VERGEAGDGLPGSGCGERTRGGLDLGQLWHERRSSRCAIRASR
jgi:hypothetical protein